MANLGHEIALSDIRNTIRSLFIRSLWSFGASFLLLVVFALLFSTKGALGHIFQFCIARIVFEVRKFPLFGVREIDIQNVAYHYAKIMHELGFWKIDLGFAAVTFLASFIFLSYFFFKKGQRAGLEHVMRGNRLSTTRLHNRIMKSDADFSTLLLGKDAVLIPEYLQYLHFAFLGASGCGKSTAIEQIIAHALNRKQKALIVDLNGSFYSKFGRASDHVLSLRDPRSHAWDFWCEKGMEAENMAAAMIEAGAEHNQYFWKGARAVLASLLKYTKNCDELWEEFKSSTENIRKKLEDQNEIAQRIIGQGDGDQADGILGSAVLDFSFLKELNQWCSSEDKKFTITEWMNKNDDSSFVYLIVSDKDLEISKPLLRVWFDLACLAALNRDPLDENHKHTWLIIDELKSIGQLPSLPAILDKGRKYKATVALGFQAISQIQKIYGEQDARSILQGVQNQFYFRMNETESAQYASDALGEQELEQANLGVSFGQKSGSDRGSINKTSTRKKVVLPDEIRSLKNLECYAKLCHHQPFKMEFAVTKRERIQEPAQSKINHEHVIGKKAPTKEIAPETEVIEAPQWLPGVPPRVST